MFGYSLLLPPPQRSSEQNGEVMAEREADQLQVVVDIDEVVRSMAEKLDGSKGRRESKKEPWGTIFKVREETRKEDPRAYDPQIVSIGPFHHGKPQLLPMEETKLQYLDSLISRHSSNTLLNYINAVSNPSFLQEITQCYSEQFGRKVFVETMVLDGCFIIEFLVRIFLGESMGELDLFLGKIIIVWYDLLLIENQIPFRVLQLLFDSSFIPQLVHKRETSITEIAASVLKLKTSGISPRQPPSIPQLVHHLLHLHHSVCWQNSPPNKSKPSQVRKIKYIMWEYVFWVLSVLVTCRRPGKYKQSTPTPRKLASATELYKSGVTFERKMTDDILDFTFSTVDGVMEIPLLFVSPITMSYLRNLLTMEQYHPSVGNNLTSFAVLMDNLIDTTADVDILVESGVLKSKLEGNDQVARFFNNLPMGVYLNYKNYYFGKLCKDVRDYCAKERHQLWASLMHTHFSSPWSAIALFGAILALLLTILQTFYAVFTYHHPKNPK